MKVYTTDRTKKTIQLLQAGGELSLKEYTRIKDKYSRMLFGILKARLHISLRNVEIEDLTEEVINDVFSHIKEYKWDFRFRSFLKKTIESKVWDKIHETGKGHGQLDEENDALLAGLDEGTKELDESDRKDLALQLIKDFVLPELKKKNEVYYNILCQRAINQMVYKDIADELNITVVNARKGYQLATKLFIELFSKYVQNTPFMDKILYDTKRLMKILPLLIK